MHSKQQKLKIHFNAIHHLQYREKVYFVCRLDQTLSKLIASFKKSRSAKMLRIGLLLISQTLPYSFCARTYKIHLKL